MLSAAQICRTVSLQCLCVEREVAQIWIYAKASFKPNQMCVSPGILSSSQ